MSSDGPSERMQETLKSPYDEDGDFWTALFTAFSEEFAEYEDALEQVETNKFVDTANTGSLERLASIFDVQRRTDEEISEFRSRLKVALRKRFTSATVPELYEMVATLLGVDQSSFTIEETPRGDTASFLVRFPVDVVGSKNLNTNSLDPLLDDISAAGVNGRGVLSTPDAGVTVAVLDTVVAEMLTTPPADVSVDVVDVVVGPMTVLPEASVVASAKNTEDELLYGGLSSDRLEQLSGDNLRGIEVTATLLDDTTTTTITAETVTQRTIGATEAVISAVSESTTHTKLADYGLSSNTLEPLSAAEWQDGTTINARVETILSVGSVQISSGSVTTETIGPVTGTVSLTGGSMTSQALYNGLSSSQLDPLSQGGWAL